MAIRLTKIDTEHLPFVQEFAADPEIGKTSNVPHPYPADGAWTWYARILTRMDQNESWVFAILDTGFAGVLSLNSISQESKTCEIDFWVARPAWGKGVCTEAVNQSLLYCKHVLGIHAAFSACLARNPASGRVLVKNGFENIGQFMNQGQFGNSHLERMIRYSRVLSDRAIGIPDPKGIIFERTTSSTLT